MITKLPLPGGYAGHGFTDLGAIRTTGKIFWVSSTSGTAKDDSSHGGTPDLPWATVAYAIANTHSKLVANRGDFIMVMPGHTESLTTAGQIAVNLAGTTVMGLGQGQNRPKFNHTVAAGSVTVTASNTRWSNMNHIAAVASVTNAIAVSGGISHVEIDNLAFDISATGLEFIVMIKLGAGATDNVTDISIHDNLFKAENIDGCASALLMDDCNEIKIINNLFQGDFNSVTIDGAAASSACKDYLIINNYVQNYDTGFTIDLDDAATGLCAYNTIGGGGALASNVDWGNCQVVECYVADAADVSGVIIPATAAT